MSSALPLPPSMRSGRQESITSTHMTNPMALPPPPPARQQQASSYAQNLVKSMTIQEMRELHRRALSDAESKQMELRLVLASRYRELVGSSDAVTKMFERSEELHDLVRAIPELMQKVVTATIAPVPTEDSKLAEPNDCFNLEGDASLRSNLSRLPRLVHRALDQNDVHKATILLLQLFHLIATRTDEYALATALAPGVELVKSELNDLVRAQMRMTFLHVQTLPTKITQTARSILNHPASFGVEKDYGAQLSASALSTLNLLDIEEYDRPMHLLDMYFDAKTLLLQKLLGQLTTKEKTDDFDASNAEETLSKIVLILQYDIILHPYQIFVLRKLPARDGHDMATKSIMNYLPMFSVDAAKAKTTNFLITHLPLIRTKVKAVLVDIAGTTASALGKIRQSLYDKTDGQECKALLDDNGVCTWDDAVSEMVDVKGVLSSTSGHALVQRNDAEANLSLWSILFSNTFSSLVHSILTTSFQSVHSKVVTGLRESLSSAPPVEYMLSHEAHRNTLFIASELNTALLKVSKDAHDLLVHAEEREESVLRLKQSLYVSTCEIFGRLICFLRRMTEEKPNAMKSYIIGRLCHLLKFRLTALPALVDPESSPASLSFESGMITIMDLNSAFELADDDDDGIITFTEAIEAVDSAFSGTQFHGANLVRETLLLGDGTEDITSSVLPSAHNVEIKELALLLARGVGHESSGDNSALGYIQASLTHIASACFKVWAKEVLLPHGKKLSSEMEKFSELTCKMNEDEYKRVFGQSGELAGGALVNTVSPHIIYFLLQMSSVLNRAVCPSDFLDPVPSKEYAANMGVERGTATLLVQTMRWAILSEGLAYMTSAIVQNIGTTLDTSSLPNYGPSALVQLKSDVSFVGKIFFRRNKHGFACDTDSSSPEKDLRRVSKRIDSLVRQSCEKSVVAIIDDNHCKIMESCDLHFSVLFGLDEKAMTISPIIGDLSGTHPQIGTNALLHTPLTSSCRYPLLPIQADRTLNEIQAREKTKEKETTGVHRETIGGGAVRAGLGFFSSMLKKT